jgi:dTDP-4-amino-4,6-dideoxygalactose transaminase
MPDGVPFVDLRAQYRAIRREIDTALAAVLERADFVGGKAVGRFEAAFAEFCGVGAACGVANGTDALTLALKALGVGPGDEVITAVNTFFATAEAVTQAGATVRFVDVDERTLTVDPRALERALTPRTRAVIPVHLYGQPADMDPLRDIAARHGLAVIEDAAQAHGAAYRGRAVGSLGSCAAFSFYPSKNLGAYGDAGMVVSSDAELIHRVRRLANHGRLEKYVHEVEGGNSRLDTVQAAVLEVKLRHLAAWNAARRARAVVYHELLRGLPVVVPFAAPETDPVYHLYVIRVARRDEVQKALAMRGIDTGIHYPVPLHLQPAYRSLGLAPGAFPVAERAAREVLSLPMYPELTAEQQTRVVEALAGAMAAS